MRPNKRTQLMQERMRVTKTTRSNSLNRDSAHLDMNMESLSHLIVNYYSSLDKKRTSEPLTNSNVKDNNYTATEYGDWLRKKTRPKKSKENLPINDCLPAPATKLTNGRKHNELDEDKVNIVKFDHRSNTLGEHVEQAVDRGYLNLTFHHFSIENLEHDLLKQSFYCVVRSDEVCLARTCLVQKEHNEESYLTCANKKLNLNEQFILDLKDRKNFDFVLCRHVDKHSNELRYYSDKICLLDLFKTQKPNEQSYYKIRFNSETGPSEATIDVVISLVYFRNFSLINQIFSSRSNSKIFSRPLNDEENKFELIIYKCMHEIESRGLNEHFIYEIETIVTDIKWAILQLERDFFTIIQHLPDINAVASILYLIYEQ